MTMNETFPGNTAYPFNADDGLIDTYITRNTPEAMPFVAKVFGQFLKAMLGNPKQGEIPDPDSIVGYLDSLDAMYDPYRYHIVDRLLYYPVTSRFPSLDKQFIINHSRIIKNFKLFEILIWEYFPYDQALLVYGDLFTVENVTMLDPLIASEALTDQGYHTDTSNTGTPRTLAIIRYPYQRTPGFSMDEFIAKVYAMASLAVIILPARIFFGIILCPEFFYGVSKEQGLVDSLDPAKTNYTDEEFATDIFYGGNPVEYGYSVSRSPLIYQEEMGDLRDRSDADIAGIYNSVETSEDAIVRMLSNVKRQKTFLIYSYLPITYLEVKYADVTDGLHTSFYFNFNPASSYQQVMDMPIQYLQMTINFP
jgi:hypothetical protein